MAEQAAFFDAQERPRWLSALGDPPERMSFVALSRRACRQRGGATPAPPDGQSRHPAPRPAAAISALRQATKSFTRTEGAGPAGWSIKDRNGMRGANGRATSPRAA